MILLLVAATLVVGSIGGSYMLLGAIECCRWPRMPLGVPVYLLGAVCIVFPAYYAVWEKFQ